MKFIVLVFLLLISISCKKTETPKAFDAEPIIKDIKSMLYDYHKDIAKEGILAEFKYLDSSSNFFWVPPGYTSALKYDSVKSILQQNAKSIRLADFEWKVLEIFPLTEQIANYTGIVNARTIDTTGLESIVLIIESGTLILKKNEWKLLNGQSALLD